MDISPASTGNIQHLPTTAEELKAFYNLTKGGDPGTGYTINPKTGAPYQRQIVPRGDYTRVLAEYWADGPDSETPPGHWFTILNYVSDHPLFEKKLGGQEPVLGDLEWDVKAYLALGGAVHDAAISAWGIKGHYDYIRPISAIRSMAERGQSLDPSLPNYHIAGIPLLEKYIEQVKPGDPLAGQQGEHINKIKLYTWRGHSFIRDRRTDKAGAGCILAENWWPYQRENFVPPPFAGYISGHSTFSRAAAEVLSLLSGDVYFPGGMSEFRVKKDVYLHFEKGPSVDLVLQWAKYVDASDQCSLSRIWVGIHPPVDDVPGRIIGKKVGIAAFNHALTYFKGEVAPESPPAAGFSMSMYPNPLTNTRVLKIKTQPFLHAGRITLVNTLGHTLYVRELDNNPYEIIEIELGAALGQGLYILNIEGPAGTLSKKLVVN